MTLRQRRCLSASFKQPCLNKSAFFAPQKVIKLTQILFLKLTQRTTKPIYCRHKVKPSYWIVKHKFMQ